MTPTPLIKASLDILIELYSNLKTFNNLEDVCFCVKYLNIDVYWKNKLYKVSFNKHCDTFHVVCLYNQNSVKLFHRDSINSDFNAKDFFSE